MLAFSPLSTTPPRLFVFLSAVIEHEFGSNALQFLNRETYADSDLGLYTYPDHAKQATTLAPMSTLRSGTTFEERRYVSVQLQCIL